jgi:hypothetical protein
MMIAAVGTGEVAFEIQAQFGQRESKKKTKMFVYY